MYTRHAALGRYLRHGKRPVFDATNPITSFVRPLHERGLKSVTNNASKNVWRATAITALSIGVLATGYGLWSSIRHDPQQSDRELIALLRAANVPLSMSDDDRHSHSYSDWSTTNLSRLPIAVVYPRSTAEVAKVAKLCSSYRIPMIPFSGGSSIEGHFAAPYGGVCIDLSRMDALVALHDEDMDCVVQPGMRWMDLNTHIKDSGLFFPVDPGPTAMIGGMVGTNCSGTNAVRYGAMKDNVVNLTVVLADGNVIKTRHRPRKSAAGYNLTSLFVGSEGTLGIVTEITLKLAVIPPHTSVAVVTFPTIRHAAKAAAKVLRAGVPIGAMEIMDEVQMQVVNKGGRAADRVWKESPTVFLKFSGTRPQVDEDIKIVRRIARENGSDGFEFAADQAEQTRLWSARKECLWSMMAMRKEGEKFLGTDVAVPVSRLADLIEVSRQEADQLGLFVSILGHVGDGNFHESIIYDARDEEQKRKVEACVQRMVERAIEMEGTCTGEHGIGLGKKHCLIKELGPEAIDVMRKLKAALDPHGLMNPGKIFDLPGRPPIRPSEQL